MPETKNVTVYSTETCPWCHRVKEYLTSKGVAYTDINVGKDREKAKEMIQKTNQMSVPVVIIGNEIILGFNQTRIDELLAKESPGTMTPVVAEPTLPAIQVPPSDVKPPEA
jgi:glutaredoxin 3